MDLNNLSVLLIEDDKIDQLAFTRFLREQNLEMNYTIVESVEQAKKTLKSLPVDIIITDYCLGDGNAFDILGHINSIPVIIATGAGDEEIAVKAMKAGADDYFIKDPQRNYLKILPITIANAIQSRTSRKQVRMLSDAMMNINDSVFITDPMQKITFVNNAFIKCYGYSFEEILGKECQMLWKDKLKASRMATEINKNGKGKTTFEYVHLKKNGHAFPVSISGSGILDELNNIIAHVYVVRDITERKKSEKILRESKRRLKTILNSVQTGIIIIDPQTKLIVEANPAALDLLAAKEEKIIGSVCHEILCPKNSCPCQVSNGREEIVNKECELVLVNGKKVPIMKTVIPLILDGKPYVLENLVDISKLKSAEEQIKTSLKEKEVLLKEIHHRVKNNMQIISSLLSLQSMYIKDENSLNIFKDSQHRVKSMALVHEKLYQSQNLTKIDFYLYVQKLASYLFNAYSHVASRIHLDLNVSGIFLDVNKAIPCGLIINELLSNSLKYAFKGMDKGNILIELLQKNLADKNEKTREGYQLIVQDDGIGINENVNIHESKSLGMQLVHTLTEQLEGSIRLDNTNGTKFIIAFPD